MINFVGAGSGAVDLITIRGQRLLEKADIVIYAGSLVNPELLESCKEKCEIFNSAKMTLEEVLLVMERAVLESKELVRLHTGDPSIYGAIREQTDALDKLNIKWSTTPGVSSFCGAASAIGVEYTLPSVSQSVVITRMSGRTPVPDRESIRSFAAHKTSMVIFLSASLISDVQTELLEGGYDKDTPAAIIYKATWPDEKKFFCTVETIAKTAEENNITKTALILVGDFLKCNYERSMLYHPEFSTEYRKGNNESGETK